MLSTYSKQNSLPHLPVPQLNDTLDKLVQSVLPLTPKEQCVKLCQAVERFRTDYGPTLQKRLEDRATQMEREGKSYLVDWWQK